MGWGYGYDEKWQRDIGYIVAPAYCDHPECSEIIDRGLAYVCADQEPRGGEGCGLYFCEKHKGHSKWDEEDEDVAALWSCCERCRDGLPPFPAKPDHPIWTKWKMADASWKKWRRQNGYPEPNEAMLAEIRVYEESL
jgi:hypothetical protein